MTHSNLVEIAYRWMLKNGGMTIAFKELKSMTEEIPDVVGFNSWESMVIECKVSRADFLKDKKKPHRAKGMGKWRFFICPDGLIRTEELPEKWGLIYVKDGRARIEYDCRKKYVQVPASHAIVGGLDNEFISVVRIADENIFEVDTQAERAIMFTVIRRLFIKGYVKRIYDKEYRRSTANDVIEANNINNI